MNELHESLRAVAREVLAPCSPLVSGGSAVAPSWAQLASLGWLGLEVPEALGGSGATFAETAVVLEELGRVAAAGPYLGCVLAVGALLATEPSEARDELLAGIAAGTTTATVATGDGRFVVDAPDVDVVLVTPTLAGVGVGEAVERVEVVDPSRSLGHVTLGDDVEPWRIVGDVAERAALAIAIDSVGIAGACLDATVEYAKVRHQFGRAIGSFQAVKHQCADVAVELAISRRLVADAPASMAKAHAGETAVRAAGTALQLHGGIGYTWEHGLHVLLKRSLLNQALFGSPAQHRQRLAVRYRQPTRM